MRRRCLLPPPDISGRARRVTSRGGSRSHRRSPGSARKALGPPVQATCVDYGLSSPPPESFILGIDEPVYLSLHAPNARLAPPGGAVLCAMSYGSAGTESVERLDELAALAGADRSTPPPSPLLCSVTGGPGQPQPG